MNRHQRRAGLVMERQNAVRQAKFKGRLEQHLRQYFPYQLLHSDIPGAAGCGKVAVYLMEMPVAGEVLNTDMAMYPNGDMPKANEEAKCGHCGAALYVGNFDPIYVRRTV
jgi:hypothetical protein